ncbi:unnamed protein product [Brachionus calyciflorus]|uniref:Uncharacterized protein n=1 Tax=Brachionus calyciflorus TaxID=104777 RepID=A0A814ALD5_9BILA|nr:unnamed protein product [Brachionus calyciflorus]
MRPFINVDDELLSEKERDETIDAKLIKETNKNIILTNKVNILSKELAILKDLVIQKSPDKKLPHHIQILFNQIDNL